MASLKRIAFIAVLFSIPLMSRGLTNASNPAQKVTTQDSVAIDLEMPDAELLSEPGETPYRVGSNVYVRVRAKNLSAEQIRVRIIDPYYQNRPQLFKNGKLFPYRAKIAELIRLKEADPQFWSMRHSVSLKPYSSANLRELDLNDWYGPLESGSYRLINRYRCEIRGQWSADSAPLLFQVIAQKK
jgi:hypothetical protein